MEWFWPQFSIWANRQLVPGASAELSLDAGCGVGSGVSFNNAGLGDINVKACGFAEGGENTVEARNMIRKVWSSISNIISIEGAVNVTVIAVDVIMGWLDDCVV